MLSCAWPEQVLPMNWDVLPTNSDLLPSPFPTPSNPHSQHSHPQGSVGLLPVQLQGRSWFIVSEPGISAVEARRAFTAPLLRDSPLISLGNCAAAGTCLCVCLCVSDTSLYASTWALQNRCKCRLYPTISLVGFCILWGFCWFVSSVLGGRGEAGPE